MTELPEIVRQRLAQAAGGDHPDPDLLTAFAENSLTERERAQVLAHLGACAVCREVVSLALPETPSPQLAVAPPARAGWLRWPILRWGGLAAALVIVFAAVLSHNALRSRLSTGSVPAVQQEESASAKAAMEAPPSAPAGEKIGRPAEARQRTAPPLQKDKVVAKGETSSTRMSGSAAKADRLQALETKAVPLRKDAETEIAQPPVTNSNAAVGVESKVRNGAIAESGAAAAEPATAAPTMRKAERAMAADAVAPPAGSAMVQGQSASALSAKAGPVKAPLLRVSAAPRWRVSPDAGLVRSTDGGRTWQIVSVEAGSSFRAVSAVGDDVWAGGPRGALYHSSDGGQTWTRVVPRSDGASLVSDIVRVEFSDVSRGAVTTASGEIWTTGDGGRTWAVNRR